MVHDVSHFEMGIRDSEVKIFDFIMIGYEAVTDRCWAKCLLININYRIDIKYNISYTYIMAYTTRDITIGQSIFGAYYNDNINIRFRCKVTRHLSTLMAIP